MSTTPYPYQKTVLNQIERFSGRSLVSLDMGLGKTAIALHYLFSHPEIKRAVVVCPASLKWMWQHEATIHIGLAAEVLNTTRPPKRRALLFHSRLLIINYDILHCWLEWLAHYNPQLIIMDESHMLINPSSRRSRACKFLCKDRQHVLALSGTPLINRPAELWPTLNILRPDLYTKFINFAEQFCKPTKTKFGRWEYKGAENLDVLHECLLQHCMIRMRTEEVLKDLPPKIRQVVPLELENEQEYKDAVKDFVGWLTNVAPGLPDESYRNQERAYHLGLKRIAAQLKMPGVLNWIDNFLQESDSKLLLFGHHRKILDSVIERFGDISLRVDGRVIGEERNKRFNRFNTDKNIRLLVGNMDAAGVGWSCRSSSCVAFIELPWAPGRLSQCEKRCHGNNRGLPGHPLRTWILVARNTTEESLCGLLDRKQENIDKVLDGGQSQNDVKIFNLLTQAVLDKEWRR